MRILIATDAWLPQVNGVVRTLLAVSQALVQRGVEVVFLTPEGMRTIALPSYPGLRVALPTPRIIAERIAAADPDAIHIATEGPIGLLTRHYCLTRRRPFTTSFHTRFADYIAARWPVPRSWTWAWLRWFHNGGDTTMVATPSLAEELRRHGFKALARWPRGVDTELFRPQPDADLDFPRPIFLTVGRIAVEKNIEAFLSLRLPGTKVVVGDGPALPELVRKFPEVKFPGLKEGRDLARIYAAADVFVFPSRTDTFGLVLLEALACGTPIAGFPVAATRDVIGRAPVAVLDEDLRAACVRALSLSRNDCRDYAETLSWERSARHFLGNIALPPLSPTPLSPPSSSARAVGSPTKPSKPLGAPG